MTPALRKEACGLAPHCPVTFIKFFFITHEALYMQDLIRFLQYFECGVVSLL